MSSVLNGTMNTTVGYPSLNLTGTETLLLKSNITEKPPVIVAVITWFTISSILATLVCNGLIILVYGMHSRLRTPFNTYIANIAITEFLLAVTVMPGSFIRSFYGFWPYNAVSCSCFMYVQQIFGTGIRYGHVLVTANRVWAVTFPVSYKEKHTKQVAKWIVVGTWIYLHVLSLPMIIRGRIGMGNASADRNCNNHAELQYAGSIFVELMGFVIPELFIVLSFPYIILKLRKRRVPGKKNRGAASGSAAAVAAISHNVSMSVPAGGSPQALPDKPPQKASHSHQRVLVYLVIGVVVCWTPNHIFYLLLHTTGYWNATFNAIQFFAQYSYSWINPLLCYMAMRPLRLAVNELLKCNCTRVGYNNSSVAPNSTLTARQRTE